MRICKESDSFSKVNRIGIFAYSIIVAFVVAMFFAPTKKSDAGTATVDTGTYSASIANSGAAAINIAPTDSQAIYSETDVITYTNTCPHGFSVTLSSTSENTGLVRTSDDSYVNTIPTISTNGSLTDNTWGFSVNNGTTYNKIPPLSNPVSILETFSATINATNLGVVYGVKIDNSLPSGVYVNDVVYTLLIKPECVRYEIVWNFDDGSAASGVSYPDSLGYGEEINLQSYIPTRSGYRFLGWSNGVQTFPPETSLADINENSVSPVYLTAQWEINRVGIHAISKMQDMTTEICEETTTPTNTTTTHDTDGSHHGDENYVPSTILKDIRDNNTYTVKKLADGKCWMTQNLRISGKTVYSSDTDLEEGVESFAIPDSSTVGFHANYQYINNVYVDSNYGGYYTYSVAGAGTIHDTEPGTGLSGVLGSSICPKNWRLPSGSKTNALNDFYNLARQYGSVTLMKGVPNFTGSTSVYSGRVRPASDGSEWWSDTYSKPSSSSSAYASGSVLYIYSNSMFFSNAEGGYSGVPIRCIAR